MNGGAMGGGYGGGMPPANTTQTKKLFVGGLATSVTEEQFKAYFASYGEVTDAVVMFDRDTQRSRGFGFVTFSEVVSHTQSACCCERTKSLLAR
jgi:RNA recognition motif-containing protein